MSLSHIITDRLVLIAVCGLATSALLGFLLHRLGPAIGLIDRPSDIKIHDRPIPRVGGIGIFSAYLISLLLARTFTEMLSIPAMYFEVPLTAVFLIGLVDDRASLRPLLKLLLILAVAVWVVIFGGNLISPGGVALILLITFICNAVNLLDGMNGLAGGVMTIAIAALGVLLMMSGDNDYALAAFLVLPAVIGFLLHNFGGRIFMGDSGSLLLGFIAGLLLMRLLELSTTGFIAGLIVIAIPLADACFVLLTRLLTGLPLFTGDLNHTYNVLLCRIGNLKIVLAVYYAVAIMLAIVGCWIAGG